MRYVEAEGALATGPSGGVSGQMLPYGISPAAYV